MLGLKKITPILGFAVALLSACGGGGGDSSSGGVSASQAASTTSADSTAVVSSASFKVNDTFKNFFAAPVGSSSRFSVGASNEDEAGVIVTVATVEDVTFEGKAARRAELSIRGVTKGVAAPEDSIERFSFYVGVEPFAFLGSHEPSTASYEVAHTAWQLPASAKIGTTGPFGESKVYSDAGKTQWIANARVDYSVEQDPSSQSQAWVCLIFTESSPETRIRQDVTRICRLVGDVGWARDLKIESEMLDSNGNSLGLVRLF